jgi:hypothetical protein
MGRHFHRNRIVGVDDESLLYARDESLECVFIGLETRKIVGMIVLDIRKNCDCRVQAEKCSVVLVGLDNKMIPTSMAGICAEIHRNPTSTSSDKKAGLRSTGIPEAMAASSSTLVSGTADEAKTNSAPTTASAW